MAARITLNLGGGAARGVAHIGAIRALVENDIVFDRIIGVSMGSICGAVYSFMPDVDFLEKRLKQLIHFEAFRDSVVGSWTANQDPAAKSIMRRAQKILTSTNIMRRIITATGVLTAADVHAVLHPFLPDVQISATEIPFATAAVNIRTGELRVFQGTDRLRSAVVASASMPLIFPPEKIDGEWYVDGGVLDKLGIETAARIGADRLIVVDVSDEKLPDNLPRSGFDVMLKTEEIASEHRRSLQLARAKLVVRPIRGNYHWADYSAAEAFVQMGYEATQDKMSDIRAIATGKRVFGFLRRII
ncbi:MAG TPA: patatin-like phospholipase family protein [Turneriella sp.]|nr:patatin-like phospholipase family protein [Turneriella sp.]